MTLCTYYDSIDLEVCFVAEYGKDDNLDPDSVEVLTLKILGISVSFLQLPKPLQMAILGLHNETLA